jgi:cyclopropane-fatty-acyl-phospholipid synthase
MSSGIEQALRALGECAPDVFAVELPGGGSFQNRDGSAAFTLRLRKRSTAARVAAFGYIGVLDAYFDGDIDIDGDLRAALRTGMTPGFGRGKKPLVELSNWWHEFRRNNASHARAKANARAHYGLGEAFYRLWLDDPLMMYTCAYWKEGTQTLEQAQANKIDHVCSKVRLEPGETVLDVGCGFGGLMFHAARNFGVKVTGTNTTTEQVESVATMIRKSGDGDRLKVVEADFRDHVGTFDKVISIGVLEHAGRDQLDEVVAAHAAALKPGGLGMLHFIGHVGMRDTEYFIRKHVFPGGWIPSLAETIVAMENHGLEVLDIENLRRHYALTLDCWAERFDRNWERIHALDSQHFDERFRRIWRTYLIGCAEMFRSPTERTHLFQILFSKGNVAADGYPMSRGFLYRDRPAAQLKRAA